MSNFVWDKYSNQPYPIKNKKFKKYIYKKSFIDSLKLLGTNILLVPLILFLYPFVRAKKRQISNDFVAIGIDSDKSANIQLALLKDLDVDTILIRIPLSDIENIQKYKEFVSVFNGYDILINILQDRRHIEDKNLLKSSIQTIFENIGIYSDKFQIGNAINRKKWAFFHMGEYLQFYKTIQTVRDTKYHNIKLVGSSVIDFEYYFTIRTLFNFVKIKYDIFSSLLYVDRRGDPMNSQMGFNLYCKIKLLKSICALSPKTNNKIYITETNWPISNTAPYAPTSELECVSVEQYSKYLVKYYCLSLASGMIDRIYWHQLIAPGYGLVDDRDGMNKYASYHVFRHLVHILKDSKITFSKISKTKALIILEKENQNISIVWGMDYVLNSYQKAFDINLDELSSVSSSDIAYIVEPKG